MEREKDWISYEQELNMDQLLYILECVRYYSIDFANGNNFWGHINDIKRNGTIDTLYLVKADANLELYEDGKIKIKVADEAGCYDFHGKNFSGKLYE